MSWKEIKDTPEDVSYWVSETELHTNISYAEPIHVELVSKDSARKGDLAQFDFHFIESVTSDIDNFLFQATAFIKNELLKDPESFGITDEEVIKYQDLSLPDFPVEFPHIVFFPDRKWLIRFSDTDFPKIEYGSGIGVFFKEYEIERFRIF